MMFGATRRNAYHPSSIQGCIPDQQQPQVAVIFATDFSSSGWSPVRRLGGSEMDTGALTISYARVKAILDDAAGASTADYGGAGRFWDNGAEALETADVYGVKMIAEAPAHACCAVDGERSKASGLIRGLRGEAPFDGGRFPRIPWGGSAVTPFDIDCIADWIDAGCPGETTSVAVPLSPS